MTWHIARTLTPEMMRDWADLTSDFNPLHLDADFASQTAFGSPIVFATLTLAIVSEALEAAFGDRWTGGGSLEVKLVGPVMVGAGFDLAVEAENGEISITCETEGREPFILDLRLPDSPEVNRP